MKKVTFILLLILLMFSGYSQIGFGIWANIKNPGLVIMLFNKYSDGGCTLDYRNIDQTTTNRLLVIGDTICQGTKTPCYIVVYNQKKYFVERFYFEKRNEIDTGIVRMKELTPDIEIRFQKGIEFLKQEKIEEQKKEEQEFLEAEKEVKRLHKVLDSLHAVYRSKNYVIWEWSWFYPEYSSSASIDVTVINPFKQRIKYIWFTFKATNPVGDPANDRLTGKATVTLKGVGPIEYGDKGTYNFERVIYSSVIETIKMTQVKIQFFDGTFKIINSPAVLN